MSRLGILIYGLQQPGCILCQKQVIFGFSWSNFCALFLNVTMITNICFIGQFCGQSINFAQVLKKNLFGPPRGPQKSKRSKTYLNLCHPESVRVSHSQLESVRVSKSLRQVLVSCGKLLQNCQMKHMFIIMVTFQNR